MRHSWNQALQVDFGRVAGCKTVPMQNERLGMPAPCKGTATFNLSSHPKGKGGAFFIMFFLRPKVDLGQDSDPR